MKLVLIGDGESPHLLKWARALLPHVELYAASSRGFLPGFDGVLAKERRLALNLAPRFEGGNVAVLRGLPRLVRWLKEIRPDWLHAHYLTSHGTLAWLAQRFAGVPGRTVGSAWGSDILVAPARSVPMKWLTQRVLRHCTLTTSDSRHMAERMRELGAREVMIFPFGLEALPLGSPDKDDALFFANRGLEPIYAPLRVIDTFAHVASAWPQAKLVLANEGSQEAAARAEVAARGLDSRVLFVGRLAPDEQAKWYARARWFISLPLSDSVSVSVLEAMAHGCVPILSNLPANRELVDPGRNGLIMAMGERATAAQLQALLPQAAQIAADNRAWISSHAIFPEAVGRFVARLEQFGPAR